MSSSSQCCRRRRRRRSRPIGRAGTPSRSYRTKFRRNYILKQVGAAANGLEGSSVTLADKSGSGEAFVKAFRAATGQSPEMTSSGAYDATATLMLAALVAAGDAKRPRDVAAADIRDGLTKINNKRGPKVR